MKVLAFAASNSKNSINKQLVTYAAQQLQASTANAEVEILDLNDYELPLFSVDREAELGQPDLAKAFFDKIGGCDLLMISFAEHNGSYTAAYKNIFDWCSRINQKVFQGKPMFLLSASTGAGGAGNVLKSAQKSAPYFGGDVKGVFSLPEFFENFNSEKGCVSHLELNEQLRHLLAL